MSFEIKEFDEGNPMLYIYMDDPEMHYTCFSVKSVAPESRKWLGEVLDQQFKEMIRLAIRDERNRVTKGLQDIFRIQLTEI